MSQLLSDFYLIIILWPEFQNFKEIFLCIIFRQLSNISLSTKENYKHFEIFNSHCYLPEFKIQG